MKSFGPILLLASVFIGRVGVSADWPQWRHDANRSGATSEQLPPILGEQWTISLGKPAPAYEHQYRMCADFSYAPVAADGMLFVPSNVSDQVMAFDLDTGALKWRAVAEGPVRFAPIYDSGRVYFSSDDGHLYCVAANNGQLIWKQRGVPAGTPDMRMIVNGRMCSRWPARGGPVLHQGMVYFGVGIWPEEGVYQNAVNAQTGKLVWRSDSLSIIKDGMCDHGSNFDLSLPPHGYSAVINNKLAVTSGRTLAAWFDLENGDMDPYTCFYVKFAVPRGNWYLAGNDQFWVQGGNLFAAHADAAPPKPAELKDIPSPLSFSRKAPAGAEYVMKHRPFLCGDKPNGSASAEGSENLYSEPIVTADTLYASTYDKSEKFQIDRGHTYVKARAFDKIVARDLTSPIWRKEMPKGSKGSKVGVSVIEFPIKWQMKTSLRALIKAGDLLIAGEENRIVAIAIPKNGEQPEITWESKIDGNPINTLVTDGKLVTATDTGSIHCFGNGAVVKAGIPVTETVEMSPKNGFAFFLGWGDGTEALAAAELPEWRVVVLEKDAATVAKARQELNALGLYGRRAQVIHSRSNIILTPYWANRVVVNDPLILGTSNKTLSAAVNSLRPFTGKMALNSKVDQEILKELIEGGIDYRLENSVLARISAPEGSADWSHESGSADNSFVSQDKLVKWPLGILWYSGDIDRFFPPETQYQHDRNPYPLIKDGRLFIITIDTLHAVDVYTGDYLWQTKMPDSPYFNTRMFDSRIYGRPTERNYTLSDDRLYCITEDKILSYDVETGQLANTIPVPEQLTAASKAAIAKVKERKSAISMQSVPAWTEVRLWGDLLIAKVGESLIGVDRTTGKVRWARNGTMEETTYTLGENTLYGLDCLTDSYQTQEDQQARTGLLFAMNPEDGSQVWERKIHYTSWLKHNQPSIRPWMKPPIPFLGYNAKHKLLIVTYNGNNIIASRAGDGSELWTQKNPDMEKDARIYSPNIMDDHLFLSLSKTTGGMGFLVDILTGEKLHDAVEIPKARTCGRLVGNEHIMTYRDASVEMYDIDRNLTISFNSMRAGCTTSFVPANGVMAAPGLQHGCVCNYPMFASLAMYHLPGIDAMRPEAVKQSWGEDQQKTPAKVKGKKE
ncbi:outer membrane biogenesis protein BamB [Planctomycetes bacterium CA13]|uniref:Outer membrane biogenesis protein BamB n=1 Tax=Novipirellula herctigrandis TaxID=2527986 RepID=A0A5C5YPE3_9BACT|nr:outer membrane biogenesis protein BamB [Planctomycetes bacterium CA13]